MEGAADSSRYGGAVIQSIDGYDSGGYGVASACRRRVVESKRNRTRAEVKRQGQGQRGGELSVSMSDVNLNQSMSIRLDSIGNDVRHPTRRIRRAV
mmetsp:Transcript_38976/g.81552  ORF Transcript_38976/g.81552 Transcript_38976/m.81552 type:complete len:96 (+) Transcript_38976:2660-2947(+)